MSKEKDKERQQLADDVAAYLKRGGRIYQATSADNVDGHIKYKPTMVLTRAERSRRDAAR